MGHRIDGIGTCHRACAEECSESTDFANKTATIDTIPRSGPPVPRNFRESPIFAFSEFGDAPNKE